MPTTKPNTDCENSSRIMRDKANGTEQQSGRQSSPWWIPTSEKLLEAAEQKILEYLTVPYESLFVEIDNGENKIRTLKINPSNSTSSPYVLLHGFGNAVAMWVMNLEALSADRPVYAIDILGFGRSSRPKFPVGSEASEERFVRSIEEWRKAVGIEHMILIGHSMGGFLSSAYSLQYPERVKHLVLLDPWGYDRKKEDDDDGVQYPLWARVARTIFLSYNILSSLRAAGPLGPWLVRRSRRHVTVLFAPTIEADRIPNYVYHCNAQSPSGERGFKEMSCQIRWAAKPMIDRIGELQSDVPIGIMYGSRTWMDISSGKAVQNIRRNSRVDFKIIKGSGHNVYVHKSSEVNDTINAWCKNTP